MMLCRRVCLRLRLLRLRLRLRSSLCILASTARAGLRGRSRRRWSIPRRVPVHWCSTSRSLSCSLLMMVRLLLLLLLLPRQLLLSKLLLLLLLLLLRGIRRGWRRATWCHAVALHATAGVLNSRSARSGCTRRVLRSSRSARVSMRWHAVLSTTASARSAAVLRHHRSGTKLLRS